MSRAVRKTNRASLTTGSQKYLMFLLHEISPPPPEYQSMFLVHSSQRVPLGTLVPSAHFAGTASVVPGALLSPFPSLAAVPFSPGIG